MKILYCASKRVGSIIQLLRFIESIQNKNIILKIASYYPIKNISIDWNINSIADHLHRQKQLFNNVNAEIFKKQVESFCPDLIINEGDVPTSIILENLGIPIWQVSPLILNLALDGIGAKNIGIFNYNNYLTKGSENFYKKIILKAKRKFVYSHFGDVGELKLNDEFEWVRPNYYSNNKNSKNLSYNAMGISLANNLKMINFINKYPNSILFSLNERNTYKDLINKYIFNKKDYLLGLENSSFIVCEGYADFVADAYYNNKFCLSFIDSNDNDSIITSSFNEKYNLGQSFINSIFWNFNPQKIISKKSNIKTLIEIIEDEYDI